MTLGRLPSLHRSLSNPDSCGDSVALPSSRPFPGRPASDGTGEITMELIRTNDVQRGPIGPLCTSPHTLINGLLLLRPAGLELRRR